MIEIKILCGFRYFKIDHNIEFDVNPFTLTSNLKILQEEFQNNEFEILFGKAIISDSINDSSYGYHLTRFEEVYDQTLSQNIKNKFSLGINRIDGLLKYLWFIKDCCCQRTAVLLNVSKKDVLFVTNSPLTTLSDGTCSNSAFSSEELQRTISIATKISEISKHNSSIVKAQYENIQFGFNLPDSTQGTYNAGSRIDRALMFLSQARNTAFIPLKIAMYVSILECLFASSNDNSEIIHKIAERFANYIGGSLEEKIINFKFLKATYNIRSKLLHGSKLPKENSIKDSSLNVTSRELDRLLRIVLTKVIMYDSKEFLMDDMNDYYLKLTFR
ncbi:hypothetical protein EON73_04700 [bacterium]|nr:MAG: hypothetical protein EON73_04700 [bacterium]